MKQLFGVVLPREPRYTAAASVAFAWAGPAQWLALRDGTDDGQAFESQLRASVFGVASVLDQSDGRTIVQIGGPRTRDVLAKGVHLDLHPRAFRPGDAAVTSIAHIGVHFWQIDAAPTFEFTMFRSFAVAFWEWMLDASAEFGVTVR